jgi:hypothetical protein
MKSVGGTRAGEACGKADRLAVAFGNQMPM